MLNKIIYERRKKIRGIALYIIFISLTFGISLEGFKALASSVAFYANINASNIITYSYIGADIGSIYSSSFGIETQLSSVGLKGRLSKIYLNLGFSQGGFFQRNIHKTIDFEVQKRYQIRYVHSGLIYPLSFRKEKLEISSGVYFGFPISGKIETVRGGFTQPYIKVKDSYLKRDIGFILKLKYNLNMSFSLQSIFKYGLNNSFDYTYEAYKGSNRTIGLGISYLYKVSK